MREPVVLSCIEVECDDNTHSHSHDVEVEICLTEDGYLVDVLEVFGGRVDRTDTWYKIREKTVLALKPDLEDAVKLAGRLAKNAGIDESGLTQALSQTYVAAVKADRERRANESIGATLSDSPCQES